MALLGCRPFWPGPPRYAIYWLACPSSFRPRLLSLREDILETRVDGLEARRRNLLNPAYLGLDASRPIAIAWVELIFG